jgi:hypothetical protein
MATVAAPMTTEELLAVPDDGMDGVSIRGRAVGGGGPLVTLNRVRLSA